MKLAAFTWTEAGQFSTVMEKKYEMNVIDGKTHHFQFLKKSNKIASSILIKISLGLNPDINTILERVKKFDKNAYHIQDIVLKRGNKNYATASLFLLKQ